jgi:hypothetical protein
VGSAQWAPGSTFRDGFAAVEELLDRLSQGYGKATASLPKITRARAWLRAEAAEDLRRLDALAA